MSNKSVAISPLRFGGYICRLFEKSLHNMIKTMRLTGFIVAAVTLGLLIFISARSMGANSKVENLLKIPGAAEQFQANLAGKREISTGEQDTPLVTQAKAFALRINPPPPPAPVVKTPDQGAPRPKVEITAKFKLIGTSYHIGDANDSWALIDEVGKGFHWVKQGSKIGYLIIEKVGYGSVLINDNGRTYELAADREKRPDLVKSYTGTLDNDKPIILLTSPQKVTGQIESVPPPQNPVAPVAEPNNAQVTPVAVLSPEEQRQQTQESIEWIKKLQQDANSDVSNGEANQLGDLGDMLKALEKQLKDSNSVDSNSPKSAGDVNKPDPNQQNPPPQPQQNILQRRIRLRPGK
jgi:hypothetical protein